MTLIFLYKKNLPCGTDPFIYRVKKLPDRRCNFGPQGDPKEGSVPFFFVNQEDIDRIGKDIFNAFGGLERVDKCIEKLG